MRPVLSTFDIRCRILDCLPLGCSHLNKLLVERRHKLRNWDVLEITARFERIQHLDHLRDSIFLALDIALLFLEHRLLVELV
jgi:hypothetical protein